MVSIIPLNRCVVNGGTFVPVRGFELAVFRLTDPERVYVLDNSCPHAGGNLAGGEIEDLEHSQSKRSEPRTSVRADIRSDLTPNRYNRTKTAIVVSCPWHHWKFSLDTGVCTHSTAARVRSYPCAVRDGVVWADLSVEGR